MTLNIKWAWLCPYNSTHCPSLHYCIVGQNRLIGDGLNYIIRARSSEDINMEKPWLHNPGDMKFPLGDDYA